MRFKSVTSVTIICDSSPQNPLTFRFPTPANCPDSLRNELSDPLLLFQLYYTV